ncbi:MAG: AMP-binding protein [Alphaproteobacteria bacterium]|nr:AMP-binding protein [Alphaproteobacteria bacterium]
MLKAAATYDEVCRRFRWRIPTRYNIARDVCDRHAQATPRAIALIHETDDGTVRRYTFAKVRELAGRAANLFAAHGVERGDRIGVLLGQTPETLLAHLGAWKLGAVTIPMFTLFGADALEYRINDAGAKVVVTDHDNWPKIAAIRDRCPTLAHVFLIDGDDVGALDFWKLVARASPERATLRTRADEPAFLAYTSGTTGLPKGALHAHRTMLGHMPGFDLPHEFFGQDGDRSWSPADWAWMGGLADVLLPTLWHGKPVVAFRPKGRFDPERAYAAIAKHRVRNLFMVPTMLKLMRATPVPAGLDLRTIISGGEAVGAELIEWGRGQFGLAINEIYGQTECNLVLAHVPKLMAAKPGALGRATPGHRVAVVDADGTPLPPGAEGEIAVARPDPVMLIGYWNNPDATRKKYAREWLLTGDLGAMDEDGYFWFKGRADDVITSGGYRIGPGEIEDTLLKHPAVAVAAAVGVPDAIRTELVKAFIVPKPGVVPTDALAAEIQRWVRERLAAHEYPRLIEFVTEMPMTATGKVMRRVLRTCEIEKQNANVRT